MEIENIEIRYLHIQETNRFPARNSRHIKALPYLSIVQSVEGSYEIGLNGAATEQTGAGGFFIAPARVTQDILHHNDPMTGLMKNRWIFLDTRLNRKYIPEDLFSFPLIIPKEFQCLWNSLFDELFAAEDVFERMAIGCKILKELLSLGTPLEGIPDPALLNAVRYIHQHYGEAISVRDLAVAAHLSESHFYAVFKKHYHTSPLSYLNRYRLTLASDLLIHTQRPIQEIAREVGIPDALYFSRLFQKDFRISPRNYRRINASFA